MDTHVRTLGRANLVFGAVAFVVSLAVLIIYGGPAELYSAFLNQTMGIAVTALVVFHLLVSIPCMVVGLMLRGFTEASRVAAMVVSAINILNFPVGTLLGAYGFWVLMTPESDPLFHEKPMLRRPAKKPAAGVIRQKAEAKRRESEA